MKRYLITLSTLFILIITAATYADDHNPKEMWVEKFHFDQTDLSIVAMSKSGEYPEDDMAIFIRQGTNNIKIPMAEGWYETAKVRTNLNRLSENSSAFKIDARYLLILLYKNNRPSYSQATLVLYDYQKKKVADVKEDIGELKECYDDSIYLLEVTGKYAFRMRLVREFSKLSDGPEGAIEDWFLVKIQNGKLICRWR